MKIAVVSNTAWYLLNFRRNLMHALQRAGHAVVAIAPADDYSTRLTDSGIPFRHVPISGMGTNPLQEALSVASIRGVLREESADAVLSYTPKGNLYSAIACAVPRRPFVPNISGLGRAFIQPGPVTFVVRRMYKALLRNAHRVIFQNPEDLRLFIEQGLVPERLAERVPGSGVDLGWFDEAALPSRGEVRGQAGGPVFLMVSRAMWDKGLGEYVEAAQAIRREHPTAHFRLLGPAAVDNPAAVPREALDGWIRDGIIEYLGATDDVRPHLQAADCVVLPSYREGVPRVLLEASAMARPVITTDAPGCRDAVVDGETGFMCRVRDGADLAAAMRRFLGLRPEDRRGMGARGRAFVEAHYDERIVIDRYLALVDEIGSSLGR